jgi:hypothetical protein
MSNQNILVKTAFLVVFLVATAVLATGCSSEPKPFFLGTDLLMVCKRPYSDRKDCYELNVANDENEVFIIYFESGGYITIEDISCTKTIYNEDICQGKDNEGNTWDILKVGSKI